MTILVIEKDGLADASLPLDLYLDAPREQDSFDIKISDILKTPNVRIFLEERGLDTPKPFLALSTNLDETELEQELKRCVDYFLESIKSKNPKK